MIVEKKLHKQDYLWMLLLLAGSLYYYLDYFFKVRNSAGGFPLTADGIWYLERAQALLNHFSLSLHVDDILYMGYNLLLTLLLGILKNTESILLVQVICTAGGVILVYRIAFRIFDRLTAVFAGIAYASSLDLHTWTVFILSDSFFTSLLLLNIFTLTEYFWGGIKIYKWPALATTIWVMLFRPTGFVAAVLIAATLILLFERATIRNLIKAHGQKLALLLAAGVSVLALLFYWGKLDAFYVSLHYNFKLLFYNVYAKGWIYDIHTKFDHIWFPNYTIIDDNELWSFVYFNWRDILVMMHKKALVFMGYWVVYSDPQYRLSMFIFSIPTILFLLGLANCVFERKVARASLLFCCIGGVFLFCVLFFMDSMYRYRAPVMPYIYIIAAYGGKSLLSAIFNFAKNIKESLAA